MYMKQAINEYLEWKVSYAPAAAKAYQPCLYRLESIGKKLEELNQLDIARFIEREKLRIKPITLVWYVNILKDFFGYYRCNVNPKLIRRPKCTPVRREFVSEEEFKSMDACLDEWEFTQLRRKVAIRLLHDTGVRSSELAELRLEQIDTSKTTAEIVTKKNKKLRWIMWSDDTHKLLLKYIGVKICLNQHPALFSERGKYISRRAVERWVQETAKKADITRRIHPHMFRHAKAHKILREGRNLNDAKVILGHMSITSTQIYTEAFFDEFHEIAKRYV